MAALVERKISLDVAADSSDSLSFAGLICIQDQYSKVQSGPEKPLPTISDVIQAQRQDMEFEFGHAHATTPETATDDRNKDFPADVLFFNGELRPQAFLSQSSHTQVANRINNSSKVTHSSSKRANNNNIVHQNGSGTKEPNIKASIQANKKRTTANPSFGWKIFSSLVSPCRECRATEPSIIESTVPGKTLKLQ